jgi:hypothetical protein
VVGPEGGRIPILDEAGLPPVAPGLRPGPGKWAGPLVADTPAIYWPRPRPGGLVRPAEPAGPGGRHAESYEVRPDDFADLEGAG